MKKNWITILFKRLSKIVFLKLQNGDILKGKHLYNLFNSLNKFINTLEQMSKKNDNYLFLLEQATIANFFNKSNFQSTKKPQKQLNIF